MPAQRVYRTTAQITPTRVGNRGIHLDARGSVLDKHHTGRGLHLVPDAQAVGTLNGAHSAGTTVINITGAALSVNALVGYGFELMDSPNEIRRYIVSNTSNTITLDWGIGNDVASGVAINVYEPWDQVIVDNLTIDGNGFSGAGLLIRWAKKVWVRNYKAVDCASNALTIEYSPFVRVKDADIDTAFIGIEVYNCDDPWVETSHIASFSDYAVQLKDCRDGGIRACTADGQYVATNGAAFNIKGSGLNQARNLSMIGCHGKNLSTPLYLMHGLANEGSYYLTSENFQTIGGSAYAVRSNGVSVSREINGALEPTLPNWLVSGVQVFGDGETGGVGFSIACPDGDLRDMTVKQCKARGGTISADRVHVTNCTLHNNNWGAASNATELRIENASDCTIEGFRFKKTSTTSKSVRAWEEVNSGTAPNRNHDLNSRIWDTTGTYTRDALILGAASSRRIPSGTWDNFGGGTPTLAGRLSLSVPSGTDYAATNVTTDRSYDANATTTDELADVLGTFLTTDVGL